MKTNPFTEIFLIATVAVIIICFVSVTADSPFDNQKFDKGLWTKNREHKNVRGEMALDICQQINKKRMTLSSVHKMLGKPDEANQSGSAYDIGTWENGTHRYYLVVPVDIDGFTGKAEIKKAD